MTARADGFKIRSCPLLLPVNGIYLYIYRYRYYPTLDDLLVELQIELSSEYVELVKDFTLPEDSAKVNRVFFEYSAVQGLAYEKITCSTGAYSKTR